MGEARRRRLLAAKCSIPEHRADIARLVRSIDIITGGGICAFRAIVGQKVLGWLGIASRWVDGAMLYRAGPNEMSDVVAFCGPGNAGYWTDYGAAAHCWLVAGDDLIDFSVGDWQEQHAFLAGGRYDRLPNGAALPPIQWTAPPLPEFWWRPAATFTNPWRPTGTPPIGTAWYKQGKPPIQWIALRQYVADDQLIRVITPILRQRTDQLVADWQTGSFTPFTQKTLILPKPMARHGIDVDAVIRRFPHAVRIPTAQPGTVSAKPLGGERSQSQV